MILHYVIGNHGYMICDWSGRVCRLTRAGGIVLCPECSRKIKVGTDEEGKTTFTAGRFVDSPSLREFKRKPIDAVGGDKD